VKIEVELTEEFFAAFDKAIAGIDQTIATLQSYSEKLNKKHFERYGEPAFDTKTSPDVDKRPTVN